MVQKVQAISEEEEAAEMQTSLDVHSPKPRELTISSRRETNSNAGLRLASYAPIPMREMRIQVKHQQVGDSIDYGLQESRRFFDVRNSAASHPAYIAAQLQQIQERRKKGRTLS